MNTERKNLTWDVFSAFDFVPVGCIGCRWHQSLGSSVLAADFCDPSVEQFFTHIAYAAYYLDNHFLPKLSSRSLNLVSQSECRHYQTAFTCRVLLTKGIQQSPDIPLVQPPSSWSAALHAAGAVLEAVDQAHWGFVEKWSEEWGMPSRETNISHLAKRNIIFKYALSGGYVNSLEGNPFRPSLFFFGGSPGSLASFFLLIVFEDFVSKNCQLLGGGRSLGEGFWDHGFGVTMILLIPDSSLLGTFSNK